LKYLLFLLLAGCSHVTYTNGPVKVERWAIGTNITLMPISDTVVKSGHNIKIGGLDSNQSEAVGKAVEGAVTAIIKGTAP
jgi:hypothetical protein